MSNSFIYYLKIHIDWITLWIGCCTGDEPHTTPADCSDKPKLDCSDLADGYYPDEYNCRCMEHLLLHWINRLSHLWTVLPLRKYWHCAGGQGQHVLCPSKNQGHGEEDLQYNAEGVMCDWDDRVDCGDRWQIIWWLSKLNHTWNCHNFFFFGDVNIYMYHRCKNILVKGWSVTNATRTATQTEVTELVMLIFWNLNINLNLFILVILIWFDIDTGGHTCDADCGPDDHHPAGDRDLIYMWQ